MAKIMLVEDDAILVEMYEAKFEMEGHDIVVASNGQECLNLLGLHARHHSPRYSNAQNERFPRS